MPVSLLLRHVTVFVLCACLVSPSAALTPPHPAESHPDCGTASYLDEAGLGLQKLQSWYVWSTGRWRTTNGWGAANSTTVLVNYSKVSGLSDYQLAVENTFYVNAPTGFINYPHYDDEGWWALAWIDAYDWTGNPDYLDMAKSIFEDMTNGWDDRNCGGGVWWAKTGSYKNAVTNELFLSLAAHLANRVSDPGLQTIYLGWANLEWQWFSNSGMINSRNLINDGLTNGCRNNGQTTWTYNQGVILGGLAELYQQNPDPSLPQAAREIALATIGQLSDADGILHESCEPNCNGDGVQFKGIFVRNLMALNDAFPDDRYVQFVRANADSIWSRDQGPDYEFGEVWSGPFYPDPRGAASQTSALDAIIAAAEMSPAPGAFLKLGGKALEFSVKTAGTTRLEER